MERTDRSATQSVISTASPPPTPTTPPNSEYLLPLPHPVHPPIRSRSSSLSRSPPRTPIVNRHSALHAAPITRSHSPCSSIPILNPTSRIIGVDFTELDLREDHAC